MAEFNPLFIPFRFRASLTSDEGALLCQGLFSEVSGLEASMTPKAHKEGGRNWGEVQLSGPAVFPPVVLKRGVTEIADLWNWFDLTTRQANYGLRYTGVIEVFHPEQPDEPVLIWTLENALPTKFKGPDLSATASQVAVEELHLVHEGLTLTRGGKFKTGGG
ncbi:MAG: phage tail protein [Betaproteobacteria bacterium]|nr:phage tail protein [Betaproteobacteria bacterium]